MSENLNPDIPTTEPTPTHPERNESMKTENTANENVENLTTEETSVPATVESTESIAPETTVDVEEVQEDDYDPNDPLFGDNSPTPSAHKPVSQMSLAKWIAFVLIVVAGLFCLHAVGTYIVDQVAFRAVPNYCDEITNLRYDLHIPLSFEGTEREYVDTHNVPDLGPCKDQIANQR